MIRPLLLRRIARLPAGRVAQSAGSARLLYRGVCRARRPTGEGADVDRHRSPDCSMPGLTSRSARPGDAPSSRTRRSSTVYKQPGRVGRRWPSYVSALFAGETSARHHASEHGAPAFVDPDIGCAGLFRTDAVGGDLASSLRSLGVQAVPVSSKRASPIESGDAF